MPNTAGHNGDDFDCYFADRYRKGIQSEEGAKSLPRMLAKLFITRLSRPFQRRRAAGYVSTIQPLRLNLGCGPVYLDGWINIDWARPGRKQDLDWDLRWELPFPDSSVDVIFTEHTLEHMPFSDGLSLFKECARVLKPNGVFRVSVPDLDYHLKRYSLGELNGLTPTRALELNELFYFHGHRAMYDFETMAALMYRAGFSSIARSTFGEGLLQPSVDLPERATASLYVEGVK